MFFMWIASYAMFSCDRQHVIQSKWNTSQKASWTECKGTWCIVTMYPSTTKVLPFMKHYSADKRVQLHCVIQNARHKVPSPSQLFNRSYEFFPHHLPQQTCMLHVIHMSYITCVAINATCVAMNATEQLRKLMAVLLSGHEKNCTRQARP
jgi:hypothetical protein